MCRALPAPACFLFGCWLLLFGAPRAVFAQEEGWLWDLYFLGNVYPSQSLGAPETTADTGKIRSQIFLLGNRFGYRVNRLLDLTAEVPVYFVRFCQDGASGGETCGDNNGLGDVGFAIAVSVENPALNFYSTGTVRFPTGDEDEGLGAGATTASWRNTVNRRFGRTTPFLTFIVANSIFETSSFLRPFSSRGLIVEFTGGLEHELHRYLYVGGSLYATLPSGTQTTFGRLTTPAPGPPMAGPIPDIRFAPQQGETTGASDVTRDNGGSLWARFPLHRKLQLQVGYTRSVRLDLHVISYGIYLSLSSLLPRR